MEKKGKFKDYYVGSVNFYQVTVISRVEKLLEWDAFQKAFDNFLEQSGLVIEGYLKSRTKDIHSFEGLTLAKIFKNNTWTGRKLVTQYGLLGIEIYGLVSNSTSRYHEFCIRFPETADISIIRDVIFASVDNFESLWVEFCHPRITKWDNNQTVYTNKSHIPRFSLINYIRNDYLQLLGGKAKLQKAGFDNVQDYQNKGVITDLLSCKSQEEYFDRTNHIMQFLGEDLFKKADNSWITEKLWGPHTPFDFEAVFENATLRPDGKIEISLDLNGENGGKTGTVTNKLEQNHED